MNASAPVEAEQFPAACPPLVVERTVRECASRFTTEDTEGHREELAKGTVRKSRLRSGPRGSGFSRFLFSQSLLASSAKLCAICGLILAPLSQTTLADEPPAASESPPAGVRIVGLQAGIGGRMKVGYWAPLVVELEAGGEPVAGRVSVIVADGDGVPSRVTLPDEVSLAAGERRRVELFAKPGRLREPISVLVHESTAEPTAGRLLTQREFRPGTTGELPALLPSTELLVVSVGRNVQAADAGAKRAGPSATARSTRGTSEVADFSSLPRQWFGFDGCDTVLLHTSDQRVGQQLRSSPDQLAALDMWVRMGGRLVVCAGSQAEALLGEDGPLLGLIPGKFEALVPLRQGTPLETYADMDQLISPDAPLELQVAKFTDVRGRIDSFAGSGPRDLPLVVRASHGFGEVVLVAVDLDRGPLASWAARTQFENRLLNRTRSELADDSSGTLGEVTTLGFNDLSGQLRGALDQFPGVRLAPFWLVALLIAAYIAVIGPLDYYFVRHVLKRPAATWVTFSLVVLFGSAGAVGLAYWLKGSHLRLNQLDLVDFDLESGMVRGTSWANVFSPRIETYDLAAPTTRQLEPVRLGAEASTLPAAAPGRLFSWFGLTGIGFGGMDAGESATGGMGAAATSLPLFNVAYDYTPRLDGLEQTPIAIWSSKAFVGRWWGAGSGGIEARLADDGRLTGTLKNSLAVPLTHSVLIYDKWAYVIRDFQPGRQLDLELDIDPQTVDTFLRRVTAVGDRKVVAQYNHESFDVPRIVEMMTAHELAGGRAYTNLANRYQAFAELSGHVQRGRAVLVGRVEQSPTELSRDGQPLADAEHTQQWTFYRYVIPVTKN